MSHGSANYAVENARRLERERLAAIERSRSIMSRLTQIEARMSTYPELVGKVTQIKSLQTTFPAENSLKITCERWNSMAQNTLESMEALFNEVKAKEWATELNCQLERIVKSGNLADTYKKSDSYYAISNSNNNKSDLSLQDQHKKNLNNEIELIISRLDNDATDSERQKVEQAATAVMESNTIKPEAMLINLKVLVQSIGKNAKKRREDRRKAIELIKKLDGVVGPKNDPEVSDLKLLLQRVVNGETSLLETDEKKVTEVRNRAIATEDRKYVSSQVAKVFSNLGYEVQESFQKTISSGKVAYILDGDSPEYAAELQIHDCKLSFRLVRTSHSTNLINDAQMETKLCRAVGALSAELKNQGGEFQLEEYYPAGHDKLICSKEASELRASHQENIAKLKERKR